MLIVVNEKTDYLGMISVSNAKEWWGSAPLPYRTRRRWQLVIVRFKTRKQHIEPCKMRRDVVVARRLEASSGRSEASNVLGEAPCTDKIAVRTKMSQKHAVVRSRSAFGVRMLAIKLH